MQGAEQQVVTLDSILAQLRTLGLELHEDAVAAHLLDSGFDDTVPLKELVKHLRDAGVPAAKAVGVRSALVSSGCLLPVRMHLECSCLRGLVQLLFVLFVKVIMVPSVMLPPPLPIIVATPAEVRTSVCFVLLFLTKLNNHVAWTAGE